MDDFKALYDAISGLGFPGGMALFIYALYKKWIIWGSDCTEDKDNLAKQRDEYKVIANKRTAELESRLASLEGRKEGAS